MIELRDITKTFDGLVAVDHIDLDIREGAVFGLIGTNGAGKSTVLRMISGILKPDGGSVQVDGEESYDNVRAKEELFFIPDDQYFFQNSAALNMAAYYRSLYQHFDMDRFSAMLESFHLEGRRKISSYSKGMKKQLGIILGICSGTKYLICDETFDGLDPVMRQGIKGLMAREIEDRGLTPIIASHNLRELEDICDHVGLLHSGGVLLSRDLEDMKLNLQKVQCVFRNSQDIEAVRTVLDIIIDEERGSLHTFTIRGERERCINVFSTVDSVFFEVLPLTLEEIFISETEVAGYDIKKIILG